MAGIFVESEGWVLRVNAGFDMSSNTELTLIFCKPDGTTVTKTTADGVALGAGVTDADLGALAANEYVEYSVENGLITTSDAGQWAVQLKYTNTTPTPDDIFYGAIGYFTVLERCDT